MNYSQNDSLVWIAVIPLNLKTKVAQGITGYWHCILQLIVVGFGLVFPFAKNL